MYKKNTEVSSKLDPSKTYASSLFNSDEIRDPYHVLVALRKSSQLTDIASLLIEYVNIENYLYNLLPKLLVIDFSNLNFLDKLNL
jgi:hypothetical protein